MKIYLLLISFQKAESFIILQNLDNVQISQTVTVNVSPYIPKIRQKRKLLKKVHHSEEKSCCFRFFHFKVLYKVRFQSLPAKEKLRHTPFSNSFNT
jgi:hypothetical protein